VCPLAEKVEIKPYTIIILIPVYHEYLKSLKLNSTVMANKTNTGITRFYKTHSTVTEWLVQQGENKQIPN